MRKNLIADNLDVSGKITTAGSLTLGGAGGSGSITGLADGSASSPSIAFASDADTGIHFSDSSTYHFLMLDSNGTSVASISNQSSNYSLTVNGNGGYLGFNDGNMAFPGDTRLYRDAAYTLALKNGNNDNLFRVYGANGGYWERGVASELLTIAAAASSTTSANLLPANSIIEAVAVRVTVAIPTATTFSVGVTAKADRFDSGIAVAATTTAVCLQHHNALDTNGIYGKTQTAAAKVVITPSDTPADNTGRVRIEVFFSRFVAPTS